MNTHNTLLRQRFLSHVKQTYIAPAVVTLLALHQPLALAGATPEWIYTVRPHDTLIQFANLHLINPDDWRQLQKINQIKDPFRIPAGRKIRVPLDLVKQEPANAQVDSMVGVAYLIKANNTRQLITVGQQLMPGAVLETGSKSKLNIRFADGSLATIQSNSGLKLDSLSIYSGGGMVDTKVRLQQGKVEVEANPNQVRGNTMQILTPTAVAAVRSTEFRVSTDDNSFREETLEGQVGLTAGGKEVLVSQGYGSLTQQGKSPLPPITLLPAPDTRELPTKLEAIPLSFDMPSLAKAGLYAGKVYKNTGQHISILAENTSQAGRLDFGDIPDGEYLLKVRARDDNGLEGYDAKHAFVLNARPFAPQLIFPSDSQTIREPNPTLRWSAVDTASTYLLELAKDVNFKQVWQSQQVSTPAFTPSNDLEAGQYFWRLASIDGKDVGPYSKVYAFQYKPKPPAPNLSQFSNEIKQNRVYISTLQPPKGMQYAAILDNDKNGQKNVWQATGLGGQFDFLLREYGKQTLRLRLVDEEGVAGPESKVDFFVWSPW